MLLGLVRLLFRFALVALAILAAMVWWQRGQFEVLALQRIDPIPETRALIAQDRYVEAAEYLAFFMQYEYVQNDAQAVALMQEMAETRSSIQYQLGKLAEGVLQGHSDESIGQIAGIGSDFLVIGDLRDLAVQGWRWSQNEETDPVLVALSTVGVAATAMQVGSAVAAAPTAGATAPITAGATTAKTSITTLKTLRRMNKLPNWLADTMVTAARQVRRQRNFTGVNNVQGILADVAALAQTPGGPRLLAVTSDAASLSRAARFARTHGKHTGALQRIGGTALVNNASMLQGFGASTVQLAATYGQRGLRTLEKTGALRFTKYSARAAKIGWKGDIWRLLSGWLALLPNWALAIVMVIGLLAAWPRKRRRKRAKATAAPTQERRVNSARVNLVR